MNICSRCNAYNDPVFTDCKNCGAYLESSPVCVCRIWRVQYRAPGVAHWLTVGHFADLASAEARLTAFLSSEHTRPPHFVTRIVRDETYVEDK